MQHEHCIITFLGVQAQLLLSHSAHLHITLIIIIYFKPYFLSSIGNQRCIYEHGLLHHSRATNID